QSDGGSHLSDCDMRVFVVGTGVYWPVVDIVNLTSALRAPALK
ncbi:hypothetical protein A2U01_0045879, partial [Trifolium medium]|nr:hypothetical protein [Trifolium medium]